MLIPANPYWEMIHLNSIFYGELVPKLENIVPETRAACLRAIILNPVHAFVDCCPPPPPSSGTVRQLGTIAPSTLAMFAENASDNIYQPHRDKTQKRVPDS